MIEYNLKIIIVVFALFTITSCGHYNSEKEMRWLTTDTVYNGFPLYLRLPDYDDVWRFKKKYSNLLCITQKLEKVKDNGLPESDYNASLMDFDGELVDLFDNKTEGIIILVETFGGARNYWYYISSNVDYKTKVDNIRKKYTSNKIETDLQDDKDWGFIIKYPIQLYEKK